MTLKGRWRAAAAAWWVVAGAAWLCGQTKPHLATQGRAVDFGQHGATRPWGVGTQLPPTCAAGSSFFKSNAPAGQNLHLCVADNTWVAVGQETSIGATRIQGNEVAPGAAAGMAQFYGWDPANQRFALFTPGALLSVVGNTVNVATDSVAQYGWGPVVPAACSQVGILFFDTDAPGGGKLYYCNGAEYESVQPGAAGGLGDPGESGLVKRTGAFVTAKAIAGVDYYAPGAGIAAADLPNPTESEGGKVRARQCGASEFVRAINGDGTVACAVGVTGARLPDLGGNGVVKRFGVEATVVAQPGVDYYAPGVGIAAADLPNPTESEGGKVRARQCGASEFVRAINGDGTVDCAAGVTGLRLADPGVDGLVKRSGAATTVAAQAGLDYYAPGVGIAAADLPWPTETAGGVVRSKACGAGEVVRAINGDGTASCGPPDLSSKVTAPDTSGGGLKYLRRNASNSEWELAAVPVAPAARDNLRESSGWLDFDPTDVSTVWEYDDFRWGTLAATSVTNGRMNWSVSQIGASTASLAFQSSAWPNLGILRVTTGNVAAGNGNAITPLAASTGYTFAFGNNTNKPWRYVWVFRVGQTSEQQFHLGLAGSVTTIASNGFGIRHDTRSGAKCGADSGNFRFWSYRSSGLSDACYDTGVAVDTSFHTFVIRSDGTENQKVWLSLDGGVERSVCASGCDLTATMTAADLMPVVSITNESGSSRAVFFELDHFASVARVSTSKNDRNP